jgi:hypothetical protein
VDIPLTLLAVGLGWGLSEVSQYRRATAASRAAIGRLLADLLDIRHYVRALHHGFELVRQSLSLNPVQHAQMMTAVASFLPPDPGLPARFNAALNEAAGYAPMTAYRLRRKDSIPSVFMQLKAQAAAEADPALALELDKVLISATLDELDAGIRDLALRHSITAWWQVRGHLGKPFESAFAEQLLEHAKRLMPPVSGGT